MTIKKRLSAVSVVVILLIALTSIGYYATSRELQGAQAKSASAQSVVRGVFDLSALSGGYLINRDSRVVDQWTARVAFVRDLLRQGRFDTLAERPHTERALRTLDTLEGLLPRIVENYRQRSGDGTAEAELSEEAELRLSSQLLTLSQTLVFEARLLSDDVEEEARLALQRMGLLAMANVAIIAILVFSLLLWYQVVFVGEFEELRRGVIVIANGNLDYKIRLKRADEFSELAAAFNDMTVRLKTSREALKDHARQLLEKIETIRRQNETLDAGKRALMNALEDVEAESENARKFQEAVEAAAEHVFFTDPDGVILYANKATESITGYSRAEMLGKRPSLWGKQMSREFYQTLWKTIKEDKRTFHAEITNRRKNGQEYFADLLITPVLDEKGNLKFFVGVERDITKEKAIDRAKTEFVSLASHQLRTPLSAMNWYNEMLMGGDLGALSAKQRDYLAEIYRGSKRMGELVDALLSVSRIELGTFALEAQEVDLCDIGKDVLRDLDQEIQAKKLSISCPGIENPMRFALDPRLARIILQNLLSNAVKYTPQGGQVALEMKVENETLAIAVSDTGIGIPKEQQGHMYEKFFRGDNVRATDTTGTGLGLYIVKSLLDTAGGTIRFESEEGKGSVFTVTVPKQRPGNAGSSSS